MSICDINHVGDKPKGLSMKWRVNECIFRHMRQMKMGASGCIKCNSGTILPTEVFYEDTGGVVHVICKDLMHTLMKDKEFFRTLFLKIYE